MKFSINDIPVDLTGYGTFHLERIRRTVQAVSELSPVGLMELGGHPWVMTASLLSAGLPLNATVSAEEETRWPDSIGTASREYALSIDGKRHVFRNYSANIERDWINVDTPVDCVLACEIIEHLVRSPHRLLLNCNRWLKQGGRVILTTPNGAQFANPFRDSSRDPLFRDAVYKRHNRVFSMNELIDLAEVCGFEIEQADYWQVYPRSGPARLYDIAGRIPVRFFRNKFTRTLFIQARKVEDRETASRLPVCCAPGDEWDFIDGVSSG